MVAYNSEMAPIFVNRSSGEKFRSTNQLGFVFTGKTFWGLIVDCAISEMDVIHTLVEKTIGRMDRFFKYLKHLINLLVKTNLLARAFN